MSKSFVFRYYREYFMNYTKIICCHEILFTVAYGTELTSSKSYESQKIKNKNNQEQKFKTAEIWSHAINMILTVHLLLVLRVV